MISIDDDQGFLALALYALRSVACPTSEMATTPKKARVNLSIAQKIKILDRLKDGETPKTVFAEIGIERIIQHETEIRNDGGDLNRKRKRNANNEEVEEAVSTWFTAVRRPLL